MVHKKSNLPPPSNLNLTCDLSLEEVSEKTGISKDWIGELERGERSPKNDKFPLNDILSLSELYDSKRLCHWFCSSECPIGEYLQLEKIDVMESENLANIFLHVQYSFNKLKQLDMERMIEICRDGVIEASEESDYIALRACLKEISMSYNALVRWEEEGNLDD